ncbi:Heterokaryon incompatibility [Penicillium robsamsonii]|uniref:Heterokaryon incompatibility n=1 Tax=Penicillium robsamsonii TaxID=1792511 RepID=UPI0025489860|nr:Heterokaryon incompatibility [Penicillium robsamsonii]KAJ5822355.1 Heterokaryon incompatibility [Penicillium robsamsonii]
MRVLDTRSLKFVDFAEFPDKEYAILSHTWLRQALEDGLWTHSELEYKDMKGYSASQLENFKNRGWEGSRLKKKGWEKIVGFCNLARRKKYQYAWMDTCCIDKSNPQETKRSIHGMWEFYTHAAVCYAYIQEVDMSNEKRRSDEAFNSAKWFNRGWTLQELLAPKKLLYVDRNWREIGSREVKGAPGTGLSQLLREYVRKVPMENNLATQLSWAGPRNTTRVEDQAYSILALLQIKMDVDYNAGKLAFLQFQKELIKKYDDLSLLAWFSNPEIQDRYERRHGEQAPKLGILAPSLDYFQKKRDRGKRILTGKLKALNKRNQTPAMECRSDSRSNYLRVRAKIFSILELNVRYKRSGQEVRSSSSSFHYVVELFTYRTEKGEEHSVGIIVVEDPGERGWFIREYHSKGLVLFKHSPKVNGKKPTTRGRFSPGYHSEETWENWLMEEQSWNKIDIRCE